MNQEIIITSLDKLRVISDIVSSLHLQVIQLEKLLSEARKEIIKLKDSERRKE